MSLKVCIVGCGAIADGHVEEVGKIDGVDVVAVCDLEILMAEQLAERFGIGGIYDDFDRMLTECSPDVVHITTPPQSHVDLALRAMDAGAHVYVEKPVAVNLEDTQRIVEHAERAGRRLTAGHIYQFDPPALALRRLVADGVLGEVTHVDSHFGYNLDGHFGRAIMGNASHWVHRLPGNLFQNNISHALAKVVEFMPRSGLDADVNAVGYSRRGQDDAFGDARDRVVDELRCILRAGGVSGYVTFSASARPVAHFAHVYGTRNTARVDYVARTVTLDRAPRLPGALGRVEAAFPQGWEYHREGWKNVGRFLRYEFHFMAGMNELLRRFYRSIESGGAPPIPSDEIVAVARIMDRIIEQVGRGAR